MLSFFPKPYPDELFYSIVTRYHIRSGNSKFGETLSDLFGFTSHQSFNLELPNNLEFLVQEASPIATLHSRSLIQEHTLYPFYRNFLSNSECSSLEKTLKGKSNKSIFQIAKISSENFDGVRRLRLCPICLEEEKEKLGESYWHRIHQVPGVLICNVHGVILAESLVDTKRGSIEFHRAELALLLETPTKKEIDASTFQHLRQLASDAEHLMQTKMTFKGMLWLRERYQHYLCLRGFATVSRNRQFKFDSQLFHEKILAHYGQEFWDLVKPEVSDRLEKYLRFCLLACDVNLTIDRVTHIILIRFLANSFQEFFT